MASAIAPVAAQSRSAGVRTTGSVRIEQPATIASSQDLMFVMAVSTTGALTTSAAAGVSASVASTTTTAPTASSVIQSAASAVSTQVPVASQATFMVAGDAGQSISVTVPGSVDLTREGGIETAQLTTTNSLADGPQFLGGNFSTGGTMSFSVGGQVVFASNSIEPGTYNGVLAVVAQYN